ncbi:hypothetical protein FJN17_07940 [Bradyrhizobium symbiodeficiens]|uniref:Uncharacterized protein n=1 Tax=Bradyrhizobium symbiodeficiens TaxID=1404367 RepID=A0ABX5W3G9_9BRAD|nr:hypothetical protein [Bradyrhizobium symbiodeficiens]QDF37501.1 hypothetical protein FJN17_07940 [Bradyrhizobium symbiodeficiens]
MTAIEKIVESMRALKDSRLVSVDAYNDATATLGADDVERMRDFIASSNKIELSDEVSVAFGIGDELRIHWKSVEKETATPLVGEWRLTSPLVFAADNLIGEPFLSDDSLGFDMTEFRMFDSTPIEGGGLSAHLKLEKRAFLNKVFIFDADEEKMYRSDLSFGAYLDRIAVTKGVRFWQLLHVEPDDVLPSVWDMLHSSLTFLAKAFPGEDYSDLQARLQERRG